MKKKHKKMPWILLLIAAAVVVWFGFGEKLGIREKTESVSQENAMMQVRKSEAVATKGTIETITEGDGKIEAADKRTVNADYALLIDQVKVENGDDVAAGDLIATLDRDSIESSITSYEQQLDSIDESIKNVSRSGSDSLTSSVTGRVKRVFAKNGDLISDVQTRFGGICEIAADGMLKVEFATKKNVKPGDKVTVSFLNYDEEGYITDTDGTTVTAVIDDNENYQVDQEATVEDEDGNVLGSGKLASNSPYLVDGSYGVVKEMKIDVNDRVENGTVILTREEVAYNSNYKELLSDRKKLTDDLMALRQLKEQPEITADGDGILSDLMLQDGAPIAEDSAMYTLISTETFSLKAEIDELDIAGVEAGQTAKVVFDAFDDQVYEGTVTKVSRVGNNTNGVTTFTVTIEIPGADELKTNMSATATIVTQSVEDAVIVPVDAVQTDGDRKFVTVSNGDTTENRYVTLGLVNSTQAQITEGVSEGESVVVIGTSEMEEMIGMMQAGRNATNGTNGGDAA